MNVHAGVFSSFDHNANITHNLISHIEIKFRYIWQIYFTVILGARCFNSGVRFGENPHAFCSERLMLSDPRLHLGGELDAFDRIYDDDPIAHANGSVC